MRMFILALVCLAYIAVAFSPEPSDTTKKNDIYLPPVTWEGYGVDWMFRSLRIGTTFADSTMADGWLGVYGVDTDLLNVDSMSVDTLTANFINVLNLWAGNAVVDTTLTADSIFTGDLVTDSAGTVTLGSNQITLGANTGGFGFVDLVISALMGGAPEDILIYRDGGSLEFPTAVQAASLTTVGNATVGGVLNGDSAAFSDLYVSGIAYLDSIDGHSPVNFLDRVNLMDSLSMGEYTTPIQTWDAGGSGSSLTNAVEAYQRMYFTGATVKQVSVTFTEVVGSDQDVVAHYREAYYIVPPTDEWHFGDVIATSDTLTIPAGWSGDTTFTFENTYVNSAVNFIGLEDVSGGRIGFEGSVASGVVEYGDSRGYTYDNNMRLDLQALGGSFVRGNLIWDPDNEMLSMPDLDSDTLTANVQVVTPSINLNGDVQSSWPTGGGDQDSSASWTATDYYDTEGYWNLFAGPSGWSLSSDSLYSDPAMRMINEGFGIDGFDIGDSLLVYFCDISGSDSIYSVLWDGSGWAMASRELYPSFGLTYPDAITCFGNADTTYLYVQDNVNDVSSVYEYIKTGGSWTDNGAVFTSFSSTNYPSLSVCQAADGEIYAWASTSTSNYVLVRRDSPSWVPLDTVTTDAAYLYDDLLVTDSQKIVSFLGNNGLFYIYDIATGTSSTIDMYSWFHGSYDRNYQGCRIDTYNNVAYFGGIQDASNDSTTVVAIDCSAGADSILWYARRAKLSGDPPYHTMVAYDHIRDVVFYTGYKTYSSSNDNIYAVSPDGTWELINSSNIYNFWVHFNASVGNAISFKTYGVSGEDGLIAVELVSALGHNTGSSTGSVKLESLLGGDIIFDSARNIVFAADGGAVNFGGLDLVGANKLSSLEFSLQDATWTTWPTTSTTWASGEFFDLYGHGSLTFGTPDTTMIADTIGTEAMVNVDYIAYGSDSLEVYWTVAGTGLRSSVWDGSTWSTPSTEIAIAGLGADDRVLVTNVGSTVYALYYDYTASSSPIYEYTRTAGSWSGSSLIWSDWNSNVRTKLSLDAAPSGKLYAVFSLADDSLVMVERSLAGSWTAVDTLITDTGYNYEEDQLAVTDNGKVVYYTGNQTNIVTCYDPSTGNSSSLDVANMATGTSWSRHNMVDSHGNTVYVGENVYSGGYSTAAFAFNTVTEDTLWTTLGGASALVPSTNYQYNSVAYNPIDDKVYYINSMSPDSTLYVYNESGVSRVSGQYLYDGWTIPIYDPVNQGVMSVGLDGSDLVVSEYIVPRENNTGSSTGSVKLSSLLGGDIIFDSARNIVFEADSGEVDMSGLDLTVGALTADSLDIGSVVDTLLFSGGDTLFVKGGVIQSFVQGSP